MGPPQGSDDTAGVPEVLLRKMAAEQAHMN
jgi:hypothetical protein